MKMKLNKELVLQVSIVLVCLSILFLEFVSVSTHAQISCNGEPPLLNPSYPLRRAWRAGTSV